MVVLFFIAISSTTTFVEGNVEAQINLEDTSKKRNHSEFPTPSDKPIVYYNSYYRYLIIDGDNFVSYYDVDITSQSTLVTVLSETITGASGTIDVSSLAEDNYTITIYTPSGNSYEGCFTNY